MSKKVISHNTQIIQGDTGEITEIHKSVTIKTQNAEEFFILFVQHVSALFSLKSQVDIKVLIKFCQLSEFNTGQILLPPGLRKTVQAELGGIASAHLSNSITRLKKAGLISGEQGMYQLNPIVAWKGDMKEREKALKQKNYKFDFRLEYISK